MEVMWRGNALVLPVRRLLREMKDIGLERGSSSSSECTDGGTDVIGVTGVAGVIQPGVLGLDGAGVMGNFSWPGSINAK